MINYETKFLSFESNQISMRKTPIVTIRNKNSGGYLGVIAWYPQWRQYCFMPQGNTVFNDGCMEDIQGCIRKLKGEEYE